METGFDLKRIEEDIRQLRRAAGDLASAAEDFPAVERNVRRILASVKMLELNVSDLTAAED